MADTKAKSNTNSENDESKNSKGFQLTVNKKEEIYELIRELLEESTEKIFSKAGYERLTTPTGQYATGKSYGFGIHEGKYQIRLAGKTKASIEKQIMFGAKRLESIINMTYNDENLIIEYKTPEAGFYRGVDPEKGDRKGYTLNDKASISTKKMDTVKKELKEIFESAARKELSYLINTKLGVEDKLEAGTASIVENIEKNDFMKTLTLKELFSEGTAKKNIEKVIAQNTKPVDDNKPTKYFLFDDEEGYIDEVVKKHKNLDKQEFKSLFSQTMKEKFGTTKLDELTPVEKKELFNTIEELVLSKEEQIDEITTSGPAISGSAGGFKDGAFSGAGGYMTPFAFKPVGELKKSKKKKKLKEGEEKELKNFKKGDLVFSSEAGQKGLVGLITDKNEDGTYEVYFRGMNGDVYTMDASEIQSIYPGYIYVASNDGDIMHYTNIAKKLGIELNPIYQQIIDDANEEEHGFDEGKENSIISDEESYNQELMEEKMSKLRKTEYGRNQLKTKPKVDKDYNIIPEAKKDSFWTTVKIDPNTHPLGMPFIKPNSKEEWDRATKGDTDKLQRIGIKKEEENKTDKKERLLKRKFFTESENKELGINKRYLICEKTDKEYEDERWRKLVKYEAYKIDENADLNSEIYNEEDENINEIINEATEFNNVVEDVIEKTEVKLQENKKPLTEETILVEKPESKFGICYKFYKNDFLNENKGYILDLNSMVFVSNPNAKK